MRYDRYRWNETRGDEYDSLGHSTHLLEVGEDEYAVRQMEIYDNETVLKYNSQHLSDEYGMLADKALDAEELKESGTENISAEEFEVIWNSLKALNQHNL